MHANEPLSAGVTEIIDQLLARAAEEARSVLYEPEVYRILELLEIRVPAHLFVRNVDEIDSPALEKLRAPDLVLKIVSQDVLHKARIGGVRQVANDLESIRAAAGRMGEEIRARRPQTSPPRIDGFLLVERVRIAPVPDAESLVGCRDTDAFGPVVVLGKGGAAAERYGGTLGRPDLALAPLSREEARRFLEQARQVSVDKDPGQADLQEVLYKLSLLAAHYAGAGGSHSGPVLQDLEINPLIVDPEGRAIAIDGLARLVPRPEDRPRSVPAPSNLKPLLHPDGVAVVGVSATNPDKLGNVIASCLHARGRRDLFMVNPKGDEVTIGDRVYPLYSSIARLPRSVDLAVLSVPAPQTPEVVAEAKAKGVRVLILIPGGFSEVAGESTIERRLLEIVGESGPQVVGPSDPRTLGPSGPRILGPNCMGLLFAPSGDDPGLNTYFIPADKLPLDPARQSGLAVISQSGAVTLTLVDRLRRAAYPRLLVNYGNQLDIDVSDLIALAVDEPGVDVIGAYIEGFQPNGGRRFVDTVRQVDKPVLVYKAGRTAAGARAAASHTAAIAGDYDVALAGFAAAGAVVAETLSDFEDDLRTFSLLADRRLSGYQLAGVSNAGFESTGAADSCLRLVPADLSGETISRLKGILPGYVGINPLMDLTPMADEAMYERVLEVLLEDETIDALFLSIVPHTPALRSANHELESGDRDNLAAKIAAAFAQSRKPMVVSVNAGDTYSRLVAELESGGVPTFPTARRAVRALERWADYQLRDRT
jgi:3-hydroxypropionyl-CoA synthetase (ADP-forming)